MDARSGLPNRLYSDSRQWIFETAIMDERKNMSQE
jgi:hypothetical protein